MTKHGVDIGFGLGFGRNSLGLGLHRKSLGLGLPSKKN